MYVIFNSEIRMFYIEGGWTTGKEAAKVFMFREDANKIAKRFGKGIQVWKLKKSEEVLTTLH